MTEMTAASWRGHLAAMLEWQLIAVVACDELPSHIPAIDDDPAIVILAGRD